MTFRGRSPDERPEPLAPIQELFREDLFAFRSFHELRSLKPCEPCVDFACDEVIVLGDVLVERALLDLLPEFRLFQELDPLFPESGMLLLAEAVPEVSILMNRGIKANLVRVKINRMVVYKALDLPMTIHGKGFCCLSIQILWILENAVADSLAFHTGLVFCKALALEVRMVLRKITFQLFSLRLQNHQI